MLPTDQSLPSNFDGSKFISEINLLRAEIKNLHFSLGLYADEMMNLTQRVIDLENNRAAEVKKKVEGELSGISRLDEYKMGFMKKNPHERDGSDFTNFELVLWSSYILKDSPTRREILNPTEAYKRTKRTKAIVDYFKAYALERLTGDNKEVRAEAFARSRAKDFIEFMLLQVKQQDKYLTFWQATSDWAINNYQGHFATWQKVKDIEDAPPK